MSGERFTLDTNILIYSVDSLAGARHEIAREIVERAVFHNCWLSLQAISEFFVAATRKGKMPREEAAAQANDWLDLFPHGSASASAATPSGRRASGRPASKGRCCAAATSATKI